MGADFMEVDLVGGKHLVFISLLCVAFGGVEHTHMKDHIVHGSLFLALADRFENHR